MKALKAFAITALAAVVLVGCNNNPEKVLPKKDGRWLDARVNLVTVFGGITADDTTYTNDGYTTFNEDGTGFAEDIDGTRTGDFTWSADEDELTITDDSTTVTGTVLEISKDEFTWFFVEEGEFFGTSFRVEGTIDYERAD